MQRVTYLVPETQRLNSMDPNSVIFLGLSVSYGTKSFNVIALDSTKNFHQKHLILAKFYLKKMV